MSAGQIPSNIIAYIPELVAQSCTVSDNDSINPPIPSMHHRQGVVFFADVSGFTSLTEELIKDGQRAPAPGLLGLSAVEGEQITQLLNDYFSHLITHIRSYHGDVIKFAGDALLAIWCVDDDNSLDECVYQATSCGLAIQQTVKNRSALPAPDDTDTNHAQRKALKLRIIISAGSLQLYHIGGFKDRIEFVVAGEPIVQMVRGGHTGDPGSVVVSKEAANYLEKYIKQQNLTLEAELTSRGNGQEVYFIKSLSKWAELKPTLRSNHSDLGYQQVIKYVPKAIINHLEIGQTAWLAEYRTVTLLFINLLNLNHHRPLTEIQDTFNIIQQIVYRYEGSINKFTVDDKGWAVMVVMGLPPYRHPDDPVRAMKAALSIVEQTSKMKHRVAIGVTTGRVYCGIVGSDERREYTTMGNIVNVAARLMVAARTIDNQILIDKTTYARLEQKQDFHLIEVVLKGLHELFSAYAYAPKRSIPVTSSTAKHENNLIGRQRELTWLRDHLNDLKNQKPNKTLIIEGDVGIGKSRLLASLVKEVERLDLPLYIGRANSVEKLAPYHAWQGVLGGYFRQFGTKHAPLSSVEQNVVNFLDEMSKRELAPLLNSVLSTEFPPSDLTKDMADEVKSANTQDLLVDIINHISSIAPTVIVLDDGHWLDSASWALLSRVSQLVSPLLLVLFTRPLGDHPPKEYRSVVHQQNSEKIVLQGLMDHEIRRLVADGLQVDDIPQDVAKIIIKRCAGVPFFAKELGYALRDIGVLRVAERRCVLSIKSQEILKSHDVDHMLDTIFGVVVSRIDRLEPIQQMLLKIASVIGEEFTTEQLQALYPVDHQDELQKSLERIVHLDFIIQLPGHDTGCYQFKHSMISEAAYHAMPIGLRRDYHVKVATWYEKQYRQSGIWDYPVLAHHWGRTDAKEKAINYLRKAADQALASFAYAEAVSFLTDALDMVEHQVNKQRLKNQDVTYLQGHLHRLLGEAERALGHANHAQDYLQKSVQILGWPVPNTPGKIALNILKQLLIQILHRLNAKAIKPIEDNPLAKRMIEAAHAYYRLNQVYYLSGNRNLLIFSTLSTVNLAESARTVNPILPMGYGSLAVVMGVIPYHKQARIYSKKAKAASKKSNQISVTTWVNMVVGFYEAGLGHWQYTEEIFRENMEQMKRIGDWRSFEENAASLANVVSFTGRYRESDEIFQEILSTASKRGDIQVQSWALVGRARNLYILEMYEEVLSIVQEVDTMVANYGERVDTVRRLENSAIAVLLSLKKHRLEQASEQLDRANHLSERLGRPTRYFILSGRGFFFDAALELWQKRQDHPEHTTYVKWVSNALKHIEIFANIYPIGQPRAYYAKGAYELVTGQKRNAVNHWRKSLDLAKKMRMHYDEKRVRQALDTLI